MAIEPLLARCDNARACPSTGRVDTYARPMPANARAILIEAFRDAHRWLDVLVAPHVPSLWKSEGDGGV